MKKENITFNKRRCDLLNRITKEKKERKKLSPSLPHDELLDYLYSLDENGRLDLSLGLVRSNKVRPEVRQYVEDNLLRSSMVHSSDCLDADVALENVTPFSMQYGLERDVVSASILNRFNSYVKKHKDVE